MTSYETLETTVNDGVGHLILNRPERYNAMNGQMMNHDLPQGWAELSADPNVRCIVFSGRGKNFCTGNDIKETAELGGENIARDAEWPAVALTALQNNVRKPVITAIQGMCAGGGLYFAAHSDINISSSGATYFDPHVDVGLAAAIEAVELLTRVSLPVALRMVCMGKDERMTAARALEVGLVDEVVPDGSELDRAVALAQVIASKSPSAVMRSKLALWEAADRVRPEALRNSWAIVKRQWDDPDSIEGPAAFAEKRQPNWGPAPSSL
jgi:enoyl-CoA hydratase/carnithine racemase